MKDLNFYPGCCDFSPAGPNRAGSKSGRVSVSHMTRVVWCHVKLGGGGGPGRDRGLWDTRTVVIVLLCALVCVKSAISLIREPSALFTNTS